MPASATSSNPHLPEDLIGRLKSPHTPLESKLKSLRDLKNLIIGNRTKKLAFLKLGAVPLAVEILSDVCSKDCGDSVREVNEGVLIQCGAVLGSFACGLDAGVRAVLDAGALNLLLGLIFHRNEKVADAAARSLKLIYQSKVAPKYDFLQRENVEFIRSLLSSKNENVSGLGASIITHSCQTIEEQHALSEAGIIKRLVSLLGGSLIQRDASLESLATLIKGNPEVATKFMGPENGRPLNVVIDLLNDKNNRTRLLACMCLICIRNASTCYLQDLGSKNKLVLLLLELLNDMSQVGCEAPFVLSSLVSDKEDMQKIAFDADVVDKLCEQLKTALIQSKRLQGILLALSDLCSKLECCRDRILDLEVLNFVTEALSHDSVEVRCAACSLLKNLSRSVKNLSAGQFMNDAVLHPLVMLLSDTSASVQVAALGAISNIAIDFVSDKKIFMQSGCLKQLVQLSKSMESSIRFGAMWALKNFSFLVNNGYKEEIISELTSSTLSSLISDPEAAVQEQALALVRNLVDGSLRSIEYVFEEDELLLHVIGRQLRSASNVEVLVQVMYTLCNVSSGIERHKDAVMNQLFPRKDDNAEPILTKLLQSNNNQLRAATVWTLINLTFPGSPGAKDRATQLRNAGIASQLRNMVNDHCLDVKLRSKTALTQLTMFGDAAI